MTRRLVEASHGLSPVLRFDADRGRISLSARAHRSMQPPEVELIRETDSAGGDLYTTETRSEWPAPFLVAYGARRGSTLGGARSGLDAAEEGGARTLFDEEATLIRAAEWLLGLKGKADDPSNLRRERDGAFLKAVLETLVSLLPGVVAIEISTTTERWFVLGDEGEETTSAGASATRERVPLEALSDGYITTASWVMDMIARWAERARHLGYTVQGNFTHQMTGVAVVDELDLHLHPRWQWEVVRRLREAFPRMTFVVTTHNPVTVLSANPGEAFVLRHERLEDGSPTGRVEVVPVHLEVGMDVESLLDSEGFSHTPVVSRETLTAIRDYQNALLSGDRAAIDEAGRKLGPRPEELLTEAQMRDSEHLIQEMFAGPTEDYSHVWDLIEA